MYNYRFLRKYMTPLKTAILESKHLVKHVGVAIPFYAACFAH
jgi:hypothetical protein